MAALCEGLSFLVAVLGGLFVIYTLNGPFGWFLAGVLACALGALGARTSAVIRERQSEQNGSN